MKNTELFGIVEGNHKRRMQILKDKNHDYAGDIDALKNFKLVEFLGICSVEQGILVRMSDKFSRMATLINTPPKVADESFEDTALDLCNYTDILLAARKDRIVKRHY